MTNRYSTHHPGLILPRNLDSHLPPWQQQSSKKHHSSNSHASSSSQSNGGSTSSSGHRDDRQILMGADIFTKTVFNYNFKVWWNGAGRRHFVFFISS